ncbi:glucosyltransferase domain-containing protein [Maridesulfovibrio zosterae]|uniref:glucosyltransferase domain-containing protein n=1 Tax=Maridesulfovibrio zosterae TaxID=82171 RepID=UPI000424582F|nr:glucosyltransferase domain-containing protein [Maridesulfovibrio zosterae]
MKTDFLLKIRDFDLGDFITNSFQNITKSDRIAFLFAIFIGFCAHGSALVNLFVNEDSSLSGFIGFFLSGRFFSDIIYGSIECQPFQFFQVLLFILLVASSGVLIANLVSTKSTITKSLIAGLFISYPAFSVGITYTFSILVYGVAAFLSTLSVYYANKEGWYNFFIGSVLLMLSLGSYQAYLSVAATLCSSILIIYALRNDLTKKKEITYLLKKTSRFILFGIVSATLYIVAVKISTLYYHTGLAANQGADKMGRVSLSFSTIKKLYTTYWRFFDNNFIRMPNCFYVFLLTILCLSILLITFRSEFKNFTRKKIINIVIRYLLIILTLIMAFVTIFVAPLAEVNILQTFGIVIVIILSFTIVSEFSNWTKNISSIVIMIFIIMFCNRDNTQYYKAALITRATFSTVNRIFSRVEKTSNFSASSKIALIGTLPNKVLKLETNSPFDELNSGYSGNFVGLSRPNQSHKFSMIMSLLGYKINHISTTDEFIRASTKALSMPIYPAEGSVAADGDLVVIKLNEPKMSINPTSLDQGKYIFEFTPFSKIRDLEYTWLVVNVTKKQARRISTNVPKLNITFESTGETCYIIGAYREKGTEVFMESTPYWFIVN